MNKITTTLLTLICISSYAQNKVPINLQYTLDTFILNNKIPAVAVSVVKLDTLINGVAGVNKNVNGTPVQLTTKFHLGSNTKAITSFIAAKLVEEGKIKWHSALIEVIPELKKTVHSKFKNVTLEQLLNHTAGIKAYTSGAEYLTLPKLESNVPEQRLAFAAYTLAHDTLLNIGNFTYSNAGYVLAAAMLEKVSKKSWEKLVEETFKELKISSYFIGFPNKENVNNAWGHWLNGTDTLQALAPNNPYKLENFVSPAGNVSMDILDYATFIQGHLKGLCGSDNYLKKEMYEKMHFGNENYALGWGNGKNTHGLVSTHNGSTGTFYCHTILYKEKKIAIIVIANASSPSINEAILSMRRTLFNGYNNAN